MAERRDNKNRVLQKGEYQNADGRYMYRYVDTNGKARFVYSWTLTQTDRTPKGKKSGKCLRELEKQIAKDLQDEIDSHNAKKMTLNSFFDAYIKTKYELKTSTRTNYKYIYKKYVSEDIGMMKISDVKYSDVKKFYISLIQERGFKPRSMEVVNTILYPVFRTAVRDGYIRVNPADNVMSEIKRSYEWEKTTRYALTIDEQEALFEFIKDHEVYAKWVPVLTFLIGTGCRIGEAMGLTWDDIDFEKGVISINHTMTYRPEEETNKSAFHISTPKTKAGERDIPMFSGVKSVLLKEKERQDVEGGCATVVDGYSGFVFVNRDGGVLSPSSVNRVIKRIVRDYNIKQGYTAERKGEVPLFLPNFSVHNLRHTFCTRLCEVETNLKFIQEVMGHKDISTTMDIYNSITREKKIEVAKSLEGKIQIY